MTKLKDIPYLKIEARNNYELGYAIGKKLAEQIKKRLLNNFRYYKRVLVKNHDELTKMAEGFLPAITKYYPNLLKELMGMSDGAGVSFTDLLILMCEEEILDFKIKHCTSLAVQTKDGVLLGHNEDWDYNYSKNGLYVVNAKIRKKRFLALSYMGSLPGTSSGLNSDGFCYTANAIKPGRFRYGVPVKFQLRAFLDISTRSEALRIDLKNSSIASNSTFAWKNCKILDIEDYFGHHEIFHGRKFLIHTNHPILDKDRTKWNAETESIKRYEYVKKKLGDTRNFDVKLLKEILKSHETKICDHPNKKHPDSISTIASVIMDPKKMTMEVAYGNPCKNRYFKLRMRFS